MQLAESDDVKWQSKKKKLQLAEFLHKFYEQNYNHNGSKNCEIYSKIPAVAVACLQYGSEVKKKTNLRQINQGSLYSKIANKIYKAAVASIFTVRR